MVRWMSRCAEIKNGLAMNETLDNNGTQPCLPVRDDTPDLWCRALSFLCTNSTLKSMVTLEKDATESCVFACRIDIAAMLHENASFESLSIQKSGNRIKAEEYIVLVTASNTIRRSRLSVLLAMEVLC
jgi:hypothetical protein